MGETRYNTMDHCVPNTQFKKYKVASIFEAIRRFLPDLSPVPLPQVHPPLAYHFADHSIVFLYNFIVSYINK